MKAKTKGKFTHDPSSSWSAFESRQSRGIVGRLAFGMGTLIKGSSMFLKTSMSSSKANM
jgi:hypothetical protein